MEEGIYKSDNTYAFNFEHDDITDIISLAGTKLYKSNIGDNIYWFGYKFNDSVNRKERSNFIDWIKGLLDNKPTEQQYEQIISRPLNLLYRENVIPDIDLVVSPRSERSELVSKIISIFDRMLPHGIPRTSTELIKNANKDVEFDWDVFNNDFTGNGKQYKDVRNYIETELLPKIHNGTYFSIGKDVKVKYHKYIKNYLIAPKSTVEKIKNVEDRSILIIDDINTTKATIDEMLRIIKSINPACSIFIFTLIGKE